MEESKEIDESIQGQATMISKATKGSKKLYLESYGCQMNFSDSEVVASILSENGYSTTKDVDEADVILMNTCSIRERKIS
jgi:tRNA-2-methylthio-N6-dimethylallyladenosine synthase